MSDTPLLIQELQGKFGEAAVSAEPTDDGVPLLWVSKDTICDILRYLKTEVDKPYRTLYDLTAIDERVRTHRQNQPESDFTVVYHLLSYERNEDVRLKVALQDEYPSIQTVTDIWPSANWYEREVWGYVWRHI